MDTLDGIANAGRQGTGATSASAPQTWPKQALTLAGMAAALLLMIGSAAAGYLLGQAPATSAPPPAPADRVVVTLAPGITMSLVRVPAGVFLMGSLITDTEANEDEKPQRRVYLEEFWIGQHEVTNAQYEAFARAAGLPWRMPAGLENHPAINVSFYDALDFCQWASRMTQRQLWLPTEAQWEKAARGTDGREFPWGNEGADSTRLNYDLSVKRTTPVGRYSPLGDSPYGAADMVGNVWEWTTSLYHPYPYRANDGREALPADGVELRVLRGGSLVSEHLYARSAVRGVSLPGGAGDVIGFRVSMAER